MNEIKFRNPDTGEFIDLEIYKKNLSQEVRDFIYPVGSLYFSFENTSPAAFMGGSWVQLTNVFIRAAENTNTGGEDTHTLSAQEMPAHAHTGPAHSHVLVSDSGLIAYAPGRVTRRQVSLSNTGYYTVVTGKDSQNDLGYVGAGTRTAVDGTGATSSTGNSWAHNNMPAYQNVYVWRRIN